MLDFVDLEEIEYIFEGDFQIIVRKVSKLINPANSIVSSI